MTITGLKNRLLFIAIFDSFLMIDIGSIELDKLLSPM